MDKSVKAKRNKTRYNHSMKVYRLGFTPYLISDELYDSMDEIERQLKEAKIREGV